MKLSKGMSIRLDKDGDGLNEVTVGCSWKETSSVDVDAMLLFLDKSSSFYDALYYGNKNMSFAKHFGDDTTGFSKQHESDNEVMTLKLKEIPNNILKVAVVLDVFSGQKLSSIRSTKCRIYSGTPGRIEETLGVFEVDTNISAKAVLVGMFERNDEEWNFITKTIPLKGNHLSSLKNEFSPWVEKQNTKVQTNEPKEGLFTKILNLFK